MITCVYLKDINFSDTELNYHLNIKRYRTYQQRMKMKSLSSSNKKMIIAIVINEKYISNHSTDGFKVGATSFTLKIADYFIKQQVFAGFILYKRDESLLAPKIEQIEIKEIKYIKIFFNFSMNSKDIKEALDKAQGKITNVF